MTMLANLLASIRNAPGKWLMTTAVILIFAIPLVLHFVFGVGR